METISRESPRDGGRSAVLLTGRDGKPLAWSQGFGELFGAPDRLKAWDGEGHQIACGAWPASVVERSDTFSAPLTLELIDGSRDRFNVRGYPLAPVGPLASALGGAFIFEEASNRDASGDVVALVSHELRTPLTVLHAALQLLDRTLPRDDAGEVRHYLDEALTEARQLNVLTGQLLEATRLQSGQLHLALEDLSLPDLSREVCRRAQGLTRGQSIELSAQESISVCADRARLEQMLLNLLLNAIMYAPGTPRIDVRAWREGDQVALQVQDYGAGIKRERLARISQPFYQSPRLNRPSRGGLGLGLFLCRELARLHGGHLAIDSQEGRGSTFTLWLPAAMPSVREAVSPPRRPKARTGAA
jgi:two-component system, chemotaxis family, CheB/CheR fusion protein